MEIRAKSKEIQRLLQAAFDGDLDFFTRDKTVSKHVLTNSFCKSGCTALHWAAGNNQVDVLKYFVKNLKMEVDTLAVGKSKGRTPLHYSCRNGCMEATKWLVEEGMAQVDARAKHGVTPFQLAIWQNQLEICRYLVTKGVKACQVNDFDCGAIHWVGICPMNRANNDETSKEDDGKELIPLAKWLAEQPKIDYHAKQRQGHSALHKAAWGGHLALIEYLRNEHGLWDDSPDDAGNFAADLADMANTDRHTKIAQYLRQHCSRARAESCAILGVHVQANSQEIRKAYLERARQLHPDHHQSRETNDTSRHDDDTDFDALHKAYIHLTQENGYGNQSNPAHSLKLMLKVSGLVEQDENQKSGSISDSSFFKARLIAVLLEYGNKGLDASNIKKKWKQVWPGVPFPEMNKMTLSDFLKDRAGDVVDLVTDANGGIRVYPKNCSQDMVAAQAAKLQNVQ